MQLSVATVKITPPGLKPSAVVRRRCLQQLSRVGARGIGVIISEAGTGKSTLLRQVYDDVVQAGDTALWLSVDASDAQRDVAWSGLVAAFQALDSEITAQCVRNQANGVRQSFRELVSHLSDGVMRYEHPITLCIDDFHLFGPSVIGDIFTRLIALQPPNLRLILASRSEPALPIDALQGEGRLIALRWDALAFRDDEAMVFLSQGPGAPMEEDTARAILQETEGWVAGMQLAKLRMDIGGSAQGQSTLLQWPHFKTDVTRYFQTQIFESLPKKARAFLLKIAVLEQFNVALAACVGGLDETNAQQLIRQLEDEGFFIIALDEQRQWFRFHHLIQTALRDIAQLKDVSLLPEAAAIASRWHEAQNHAGDAIFYAIQAHDYERATQLVEHNALAFVNRGALAPLADWIAQLPQDLKVQRPQLPVYLCFLYVHMCKSAATVEREYEAAKITIETLQSVGHFKDPASYHALLRQLDVIGILILFLSGQMQRLLEEALAVLEHVESLPPLFAASLYNVCGQAHYRLGDHEKGRTFIEQAYALHHASGATIGTVYARCFLGQIALSEAQTHVARSHFMAAYRFCIDELGQDEPLSCIPMLHLAVLGDLSEEDRIDSSDLERYLKETQHCCEPETFVAAQLVYRRQLLHEGQPMRAEAVLKNTRTYAEKSNNMGLQLRVLHAAIQSAVRIQDVNDVMALYRQAQALNPDMDRLQTNGVWERAHYWHKRIQADVFQATARPRSAIPLYKEMLAHARSTHKWQRVLELNLKLSTAYASCGEESQSQTAMISALSEAARSGIVRPFLDAGAEVFALIERCPLDDELSCFYDSLRGFRPDPAQPGMGTTGLLQELTEREISILKQLVQGARNQEICSHTGLSSNTVKWYLKRIFQKLGVSSRTQAALIARSLFSAI
jgi:LuxR family maltose regulon positive regulatory protein